MHKFSGNLYLIRNGSKKKQTFLIRKKVLESSGTHAKKSTNLKQKIFIKKLKLALIIEI